MVRRSAYFLLFSLIVALVSACTALPAPATSEGADAVAGDTAATRGILRMPHFLARDGAESLDPASPTEFSYSNYLL